MSRPVSIDYAQVARIYLDALHAGKPPVKAVTEATAVSHAVARWRVSEARRRGFISPAAKRGIARPDLTHPGACPLCGALPSRQRYGSSGPHPLRLLGDLAPTCT